MIDTIRLAGGVHIVLANAERGDGWNIFELGPNYDIRNVFTENALPVGRWFQTRAEAVQFSHRDARS